MRWIMAVAVLMALGSCGSSGGRISGSASGPIGSTCISAGRSGASGALCSCVQAAANQTLGGSDQARALPSEGLQGQLVSPVFQDAKGTGEFKVVSFYAKRARGLMARYIVQNRLTSAESLQDFDLEGYRFEPGLSTVERPVFRRRQDSR